MGEGSTSDQAEVVEGPEAKGEGPLRQVARKEKGEVVAWGVTRCYRRVV